MTEILSSGYLWWPVLILAALTLAYLGAPRLVWTPAYAVLLGAFTMYAETPALGKLGAWLLFLLPAVVFNVPDLRRRLVSDRVFNFYRRAMPEISETERAALDAGTVWWDAELFTGRPRWRRLLDFPSVSLSREEREFLEGPVEELCEMLDDYRVDNIDHDLPAEAWRFIRENGFFGMVIPVEHGGKGFSQYGHAAVVMKIASRSISAALTVMIPNSVGPAKLLLKYGTDGQKKQYLSRLAKGEEIPCFALTAPTAGSDAGALPDAGVICRRDVGESKNVLGIRLNFDKRYITLGPVATLLGVAFQLRDPDGLLGGEKDLGITLALVPADTPGVEKGARHNPMHMAFMNGPVRGRDVFVPLEQIIGGREQAGNGWRMLMESLTDGRAISLPALSTAAAKTSARITGAYARIREQFNVPIGLFEGVEAALARIAGNTYTMDAARLVTLAALDEGHKPSVISAIMKYNLTDRARRVVDDAIEVHGGAAVCLGPGNPLGQLHSFPPVSVTVEGHNILTRNLITFGQGAIRCHPFLLRELTAVQNADETEGRKAFDRALTGHIGFSIRNGVRALVLGLTDGRPVLTPSGTRPLGRYYRQLSRMSAVFAVVSDLLLLVYRGSLKRRERVSARMADVFSQLYLASTVLKRYHDQGRESADLVLARWACEDALYRAQQAFEQLSYNVDSRWLAWAIRRFAWPIRRSFRGPSDRLEHEVAATLLAPSSVRDRLTAGMFLSSNEDDPMRRREEAFRRVVETQEQKKKLKAGCRRGLVTGDSLSEQIASAREQGVLTESEAEALERAEELRWQAIQVDEFARL